MVETDAQIVIKLMEFLVPERSYSVFALISSRVKYSTS
jgi:hypothetical protein